MAEKDRKGGCLTGVAWMAEAARVSSAAVIDATELDEPSHWRRLPSKADDGSWARERTVWRLCSKAVRDTWARLTANGCGSPRTVSSDAGARAVVQGLNDSVDQLGAASSFDLAMGWSA
jgi:hypothetical protein